jgi:hypothetical protein
MEPEGSLPHSQVPATCLYPEPAQSSPDPTSHFLMMHLNSILPSMPGSPHWSLSLRFPHQNPVHASPLPHPSYMPRPSHSSRLYHTHNSGWGVHINTNKHKIHHLNSTEHLFVASHNYSPQFLLSCFLNQGRQCTNCPVRYRFLYQKEQLSCSISWKMIRQCSHNAGGSHSSSHCWQLILRKY